MPIPTAARIAMHMGVSDNMAAHFLRAFHAAGLEEFGSSFGQAPASIMGDPVPLQDSEALQTLARAAVSGLRLMCMNPTMRDHWRVRDDGSLYLPPRENFFNEPERVFTSNGVITDAP